MADYLVFMDIDGTLIDDQQRVQPITQSVIRLLAQKNVQFYIATGRMYQSAAIVRESLTPNMGIVASNGSVYSLDDQIVKHHLAPEVIPMIIELCTAYGVNSFFFGTQKVYYTQQLPDYFKQSDQNRIASGKPDDYVHLTAGNLTPAIVADIINGIIIEDQDLTKLTPIRERLGALEGLTISTSNPNNIELIPDGISKASAIQAIQESLQIDQRHTFAFGDGMNDAPMFTVADLSVAMGNAQPAVKEAAHYQTNANDEDGIGRFLADYFNLKEIDYHA